MMVSDNGESGAGVDGAAFQGRSNSLFPTRFVSFNTGIYQFTFGTDGSQVKGRYSFIYVFEDWQWKIAHHHSSQMPGDTVRKGKA